MTADNFQTFSVCKFVSSDVAYECFAVDKSNIIENPQSFFIPKGKDIFCNGIVILLAWLTLQWNNIWCIKNRTNHSSKTFMSLVRFLLHQTLIFKNGLKIIQAVAYNVACMVSVSFFMFLSHSFMGPCLFIGPCWPFIRQLFNSQYFWKWTNANPMKILGQLASHPKLLIGSKLSLS